MMNYCESCKHGGNCEHEWRYSKLVYGCEKYAKVMTNEEYLKSCTTEQLAEVLWNYTHDIISDYERIRNPILREMPLKNILGDNCTKKEAWVEWLKQPHKEQK